MRSARTGKRSSIRSTRASATSASSFPPAWPRKSTANFPAISTSSTRLPPGLYEAVFESKGEDTAHPELAPGQWVMRCEARTLDDIRALGGNDAADERRFATAARVSENNLALYREFAQPIVRAFVNPPLAQWLQQLHPLRLQYELFSNANPMMAPVAAMAEQVRNNRRSVAADNPLVQLQETVSSQIVAGLNAWRDMIESAGRADLPDDLWLPAAAGRRRNRSERQPSVAQGRQASLV